MKSLKEVIVYFNCRLVTHLIENHSVSSPVRVLIWTHKISDETFSCFLMGNLKQQWIMLNSCIKHDQPFNQVEMANCDKWITQTLPNLSGVTIVKINSYILGQFYGRFRLPAGFRYRSGNRSHYLQLAGTYQVEKFE